MLTAKEELDKINTKSAKGNAESEELPQYLRSSYSQTYQQLEPAKTFKGKKVFPQFAYGNSHEAPTYFKLSNSLVCRESYDNPYIKNKVPPLNKIDSLKGSTLNNYEFYNVSDQRFTNRKPTGYITNKITEYKINFNIKYYYKLSQNCIAKIQQFMQIREQQNNMNNKVKFKNQFQWRIEITWWSVFSERLENDLFNSKIFKNIYIKKGVSSVQKPFNDEQDQIFTFESAYKSIQDKFFNKKRELFTDFVEKNDLLNVYGPLNMRTRPKEFREVKNYALDSEQLKLLKEQRSRYSRHASFYIDIFEILCVDIGISFMLSQKSVTFGVISNPLCHFYNLPQIINFQIQLRCLVKLFIYIIFIFIQITHLMLQQITPTNRSGFTDLIKTVRLPTISKMQGLDTDKYYNKDQNYLNQLTNSIIVEKIDQKIKLKNKTLQSLNKNKHSIKHNTEDTENMQGIIDIFEKHLEFEKQYNC